MIDWRNVYLIMLIKAEWMTRESWFVCFKLLTSFIMCLCIGIKYNFYHNSHFNFNNRKKNCLKSQIHNSKKTLQFRQEKLLLFKKPYKFCKKCRNWWHFDDDVVDGNKKLFLRFLLLCFNKTKLFICFKFQQIGI